MVDKITADYLADLVNQKKNLVSTLQKCGVGANENEKFNTLVPKVAEAYNKAKLEDSDYSEGFTAGQNSVLNGNKIIEATVNGKGTVTINDVSEIPHKITTQLTNIGTVSAQVIPTAVEVPIEYFTLCDVTVLKNIWYDNDEGMYVASVYCEQTTNSLNSGGEEYLYITPNDDGFMPEGEYNHTVAFEEIMPGVLFMHINNINKAAYKALTVSDGNTNTVTYIANVDGIVDGIVSYSTNMTFSVDNENIIITVNYHKSWGIYHAWSLLQNNGKAMNYYYMFAYRGNDTNYQPVCDIVCNDTNTGSQSIFYSSNITDTKVPIYATKNIGGIFYNCSKLKRVPLLFMREDTTSSNAFSGCSELTDITIDGVIGKSFNISACSKLTVESTDSIIEHLKDLTGATSQTLTVHADVYDSMVAEGKDILVTTKNWALAKA